MTFIDNPMLIPERFFARNVNDVLYCINEKRYCDLNRFEKFLYHICIIALMIFDALTILFYRGILNLNKKYIYDIIVLIMKYFFNWFSDERLTKEEKKYTTEEEVVKKLENYVSIDTLNSEYYTQQEIKDKFITKQEINGILTNYVSIDMLKKYAIKEELMLEMNEKFEKQKKEIEDNHARIMNEQKLDYECIMNEKNEEQNRKIQFLYDQIQTLMTNTQ